MDARIARAVVLTAALVSSGANYRTKNFVVSAPTQQMAEEIGRAAEAYRKELSREWLGAELRPWAQPCPIVAQVGERLGAGGATSFVFDHGEVFGWQMNIQGSFERILDSVLPHEITHTVFASHFRQPLPRWADEGACTTVEHASERAKQHQMLIEFLKTRRGIAFNQMFAMKEYPRDVLPLYSQGYSLARFLIFQHGRREFVSFLEDGLRGENWPQAIESHYGYRDLGVLQDSWLAWVREGSPSLAPGNEQLEGDSAVVLVSNGGARRARPQPAEPLVVRGNSPERESAPAERSPHAYAASSARSPRLVDREEPTEADWRSVKRNPRRESRPPSDSVAADARRDAAAQATESADAAPDADPFLAPGRRRPAAADASAARSARGAAPLEVEAVQPLVRVHPAQSYQATRPQQPEPVRQTILEWSRSAADQ